MPVEPKTLYIKNTFSIGLNEATIRKYIREQDNADIMLDRMTSKEYTDPFRPKQGKLL